MGPHPTKMIRRNIRSLYFHPHRRGGPACPPLFNYHVTRDYYETYTENFSQDNFRDGKSELRAEISADHKTYTKQSGYGKINMPSPILSRRRQNSYGRNKHCQRGSLRRVLGELKDINKTRHDHDPASYPDKPAYYTGE